MRVTRTYLELQDPGQFRPAFGTHPDITVAHVPAPAPELYRQCYRTVGEAYHWRDRWEWTDKEIRAHLADPAITFVLARRSQRSRFTVPATAFPSAGYYLVTILVVNQGKVSSNAFLGSTALAGSGAAGIYHVQ